MSKENLQSAVFLQHRLFKVRGADPISSTFYNNQSEGTGILMHQFILPLMGICW